MATMEFLEEGKCPNGCGGLTFLEEPIAIYLIIPYEVIEMAQDNPLYGGDEYEMIMNELKHSYILAVCPKCGFTLNGLMGEHPIPQLDDPIEEAEH